MRAAPWLLVPAAACAEPHVTLRAPAPTITPAERVAMFQALERADQETVTVSHNHGPWEVAGSTLVLADGSHIQLPEDLLPVVAQDSDTARAARASADAGHRANTWMYLGFGALVAGAATLFAVEVGGASVGIPEGYLLGGVALAAALPFFAARHERGEEMNLRLQAFATYTRDLGVRLDVCAHGLDVVPCEAPAPSQAPGMTTP